MNTAVSAVARLLVADAASKRGWIKASTVSARLGLPRVAIDAALAELIRRGLVERMLGSAEGRAVSLYRLHPRLRRDVQARIEAEAAEQAREEDARQRAREPRAVPSEVRRAPPPLGAGVPDDNDSAPHEPRRRSVRKRGRGNEDIGW
jgi:hypothetical protein